MGQRQQMPMGLPIVRFSNLSIRYPAYQSRPESDVADRRGKWHLHRMRLPSFLLMWNAAWLALAGWLEKSSVAMTVAAVASAIGLSLTVAYGRRAGLVGLNRPTQKLAFGCLSLFWGIVVLSIGIEGRGGTVGNSPPGITVVLVLLCGAAALFLIDFWREIRKPPQDIPDSWR